MPQVIWSADGRYKFERWEPGEAEARQLERTLQLVADRLELEDQARWRHLWLLDHAVKVDSTLGSVVMLHAPTPDTRETVACTGCPDSYDGRPEWPCRTFSLIERAI